MKTAVFYHSYHHGNTKKILEAMAQQGQMELVDATSVEDFSPDTYDILGFASGIYGFSVHDSVIQLARKILPPSKPTFFVYTYGLNKGTGADALRKIAQERGCPVLGEFSCRGYDTFGPFRWMGGLAKGHPDQQDLKMASDFFREIQNKWERG